MRSKVISFLREHPFALRALWRILRWILSFTSFFVRKNDKAVLIASFGGRSFDDSPKAIYDELCSRKEFNDWEIIWAFVDPDKHDIPRGKKIKIDTIDFFYHLIYCKVWISNSGMDRNIELNLKRTIKIETWHGTPLKKIGADQNTGVLGSIKEERNKKADNKTIRCAQSEYDRSIFERVFNATKETFLMCDLPRNDSLLKYTEDDNKDIKNRLGINEDSRIVLYMPTYREFSINDNKEYYLAPPINISKWAEHMENKYVVLVRAHYAVSAALNIEKDSFVIDVSDYPCLNDLYSVADILISDYSSAFFDYSILAKPMLCFAYDYEEYSQKRGLYIDVAHDLPFPVVYDEDSLLEKLLKMDMREAEKQSELFRKKYAPFAGGASKTVVDELLKRINKRN